MPFHPSILVKRKALCNGERLHFRGDDVGAKMLGTKMVSPFLVDPSEARTSPYQALRPGKRTLCSPTGVGTRPGDRGSVWGHHPGTYRRDPIFGVPMSAFGRLQFRVVPGTLRTYESGGGSSPQTTMSGTRPGDALNRCCPGADVRDVVEIDQVVSSSSGPAAAPVDSEVSFGAGLSSPLSDRLPLPSSRAFAADDSGRNSIDCSNS